MEYKYKGFVGLVHTYEDGIYYGTVTNLDKDVVTFCSDSYDNCENEFQISVDDYIEMFEIN